MMDEPVTYAATQPPVELAKMDFRMLLTLDEQRIIDNFSVPEFAEWHQRIVALTVEQRANVRTAIATYRDARVVMLSDASTIQFVHMLEGYGLLPAGRGSQILSGQVPQK